jgi:DNA-binding beta-propeller fold protein YncE
MTHTPHTRVARRSLAMLTACALLAAFGAARAHAKRPDAAPPALVWPGPPDTARVRWAGELQRGTAAESGNFALTLRRLFTGGSATPDAQLVRPTDVYAEDSTRVYVTDAAQSRVFVLERGQHAMRALPIEGAGAPSKPMGITGDGRGLLYVTDPPGRRVVVIDRAGHFVRAFGGRGVLLNPVDVAVDTSAHLAWVVDSWLHQVLAFDERGNCVRTLGLKHGDAHSKSVEQEPHGTAAERSLSDVHRSQAGSRDVRENRGGGPGEFLYPCGVAVSAAGDLFVSDGLNARVQVFGRDGAFRRTFGHLGDGPGAFARPKGIALDPRGNVYVVDAAFNNVQIFDPEGRLLLAFGQFGSGPGQLRLPLGLWIDRLGTIYVADRYNARVETFAIFDAAGAQHTRR